MIFTDPDYAVGVGGPTAEDIGFLQNDGLLALGLSGDGGACPAHAGADSDYVDFHVPRVSSHQKPPR